MVTVVWAAMEEATPWALAIADWETGVPRRAHMVERGPRRDWTSIVESQAVCMQRTTSGRKRPERERISIWLRKGDSRCIPLPQMKMEMKVNGYLPLDSRHMHFRSLREQLSSVDWFMHWLMHGETFKLS
jgi:hypothetical protein